MMNRQSAVHSPRELIASHGPRLRDLIGKPLVASWVAWDAATGEWFKDEAVILHFPSTHLEIVCWKLGEIILSWDAIDLSQPPAWVAYWSGTDFSLEWRQDQLPELTSALGRPITEIFLVEYCFNSTVVASKTAPRTVGTSSSTWLLIGLEFHYEGGLFRVFNGLDENAVSDEPLIQKDYRLTQNLS